MRRDTVDLSSYGYNLLSYCGGGTFGKAYRVKKVGDGSLKIAKTVELTDLLKSGRENALQEATLLLKLKHPHIVSCCEAFIHNDTYLVMIMEYCQGGDMACCLNSMRRAGTYFPEAEVVKMLRQLLSALTFIHEHKILHRDLKPSNIFINKQGDLKIGDFGVSRIMTSTTCNAHTSIGTPNYMPPEMCKRKPYTFHSDMWSLGCVLYEIVTLRTAFCGDSLIALAWNVCFENPTPIEGNYSKALKVIVSMLLSKEPEQRWLPATLLYSDYMTEMGGYGAPREILLARSSLLVNWQTSGHLQSRGDSPRNAGTYEPAKRVMGRIDETETDGFRLPPDHPRKSEVSIAPRTPPRTPASLTSPSAHLDSVLEERVRKNSNGASSWEESGSATTRSSAAVQQLSPLSNGDSSAAASTRQTGNIAEEALACQLLLKKLQNGALRNRLPLSLMLLMVHKNWLQLVASSRHWSRNWADVDTPGAACGGTSGLSNLEENTRRVIVKAVENEFENLPDSIISKVVDSGGNCLEEALMNRVDVEILLNATARFDLGLSRSEIEGLLTEFHSKSSVPSFIDIENIVALGFLLLSPSDEEDEERVGAASTDEGSPSSYRGPRGKSMSSVEAPSHSIISPVKLVRSLSSKKAVEDRPRSPGSSDSEEPSLTKKTVWPAKLDSVADLYAWASKFLSKGTNRDGLSQAMLSFSKSRSTGEKPRVDREHFLNVLSVNNLPRALASKLYQLTFKDLEGNVLWEETLRDLHCYKIHGESLPPEGNTGEKMTGSAPGLAVEEAAGALSLGGSSSMTLQQKQLVESWITPKSPELTAGASAGGSAGEEQTYFSAEAEPTIFRGIQFSNADGSRGAGSPSCAYCSRQKEGKDLKEETDVAVAATKSLDGDSSPKRIPGKQQQQGRQSFENALEVASGETTDQDRGERKPMTSAFLRDKLSRCAIDRLTRFQPTSMERTQSSKMISRDSDVSLSPHSSDEHAIRSHREFDLIACSSVAVRDKDDHQGTTTTGFEVGDCETVARPDVVSLRTPGSRSSIAAPVFSRMFQHSPSLSTNEDIPAVSLEINSPLGTSDGGGPVDEAVAWSSPLDSAETGGQLKDSTMNERQSVGTPPFMFSKRSWMAEASSPDIASSSFATLKPTRSLHVHHQSAKAYSLLERTRTRRDDHHPATGFVDAPVLRVNQVKPQLQYFSELQCHSSEQLIRAVSAAEAMSLRPLDHKAVATSVAMPVVLLFELPEDIETFKQGPKRSQTQEARPLQLLQDVRTRLASPTLREKEDEVIVGDEYEDDGRFLSEGSDVDYPFSGSENAKRFPRSRKEMFAGDQLDEEEDFGNSSSFEAGELDLKPRFLPRERATVGGASGCLSGYSAKIGSQVALGRRKTLTAIPSMVKSARSPRPMSPYGVEGSSRSYGRGQTCENGMGSGGLGGSGGSGSGGGFSGSPPGSGLGTFIAQTAAVIDKLVGDVLVLAIATLSGFLDASSFGYRLSSTTQLVQAQQWEIDNTMVLARKYFEAMRQKARSNVDYYGSVPETANEWLCEGFHCLETRIGSVMKLVRGFKSAQFGRDGWLVGGELAGMTWVRRMTRNSLSLMELLAKCSCRDLFHNSPLVAHLVQREKLIPRHVTGEFAELSVRDVVRVLEKIHHHTRFSLAWIDSYLRESGGQADDILPSSRRRVHTEDISEALWKVLDKHYSAREHQPFFGLRAASSLDSSPATNNNAQPSRHTLLPSAARSVLHTIDCGNLSSHWQSSQHRSVSSDNELRAGGVPARANTGAIVDAGVGVHLSFDGLKQQAPPDESLVYDQQRPVTARASLRPASSAVFRQGASHRPGPLRRASILVSPRGADLQPFAATRAAPGEGGTGLLRRRQHERPFSLHSSLSDFLSFDAGTAKHPDWTTRNWEPSLGA